MTAAFNDEDQEIDLNSRCALHTGGEVSRLLGRIEGTLREMRRDIQEGVDVQKNIGLRLEAHDGRISKLEESERNRVRVNRVLSVVGLALLVPALTWANHVYVWFSEVSAICFPGDKR